MKKFLSIFVALAMVLSLFAGVGAHSAKAAVPVTLTATASGATLTGGADAVTGTDAVGKITAIAANGTDATVTTTTAGVGAFAATTSPITRGAAPTFTVAVTSTDVDWLSTGYKLITFSDTSKLCVGDTVTVAGTTPGVGTVQLIVNGTDANVQVGTAQVTPSTTFVTVTGRTQLVAVTSTDVDWLAAIGSKTITFNSTTTLRVDDVITVDMINTAAVAATGTVTIGGTVTADQVVTVTVNGTAYNYTVLTASTPGTVAAQLAALIDAGGTGTYDAAALGTVITITATTAGVAGNAITLTATPATATSGTPTGVPAGIVTLTATQPNGATSVLLSWSYSPNAGDVTAFQIYRNGAVIAYVAPGTTAYTDATTVAGSFYTYYVTPVNNMGSGTQSYSQSVLVTAATAATTTTSTLALTTTGTFVGGVDGSGALGVDGIGTVTQVIDSTHAVVNVTTAAVGTFDNNPDTGNFVTALRNTGSTTVDTDWATTGIKTITLTNGGTIIPITVGMTIGVVGTSTNGSGKVLGISSDGLTAVVNVTTAVVGIMAAPVYRVSTVYSADQDWMTVGTAQPITFDAAITPSLSIGDRLDVHMLQTVAGTSATAFLMVTGVPVVGDVATVTWQDTAAASHTVSYTVVAGDLTTGIPANNIATDLADLINALELTTGNVSVLNMPSGSVVQLTQDVVGVAGNGKTITGTTTAAVVPTLTITTVGGLTQPAYVENGKTIQLVAKDATGAVVSVTWSSSVLTNAIVSSTGLVTANSVAIGVTGVTVITGTSGTATGVFAVVVIPVQVITSLTINLVPAVPVSTTSQQFGAIASNATYSALDYTTQVVWTDALPVASIAATTGLLTYSTDETGNVYAAAGGITATAAVKIATGVVTLVTVVGPVTKVVVLTIGSDIVTVDDKATTVDAAPEIVDGRTFVPIRFIAETFGSTVTWLPETKGITIVLGDTTIGLQIGNATAVINGTIIALDAAPYIKNSRTMVPLRVITESFGGNVAWDPINHIITITYVLPVLPAA
jgi:hypothetical protein